MGFFDRWRRPRRYEFQGGTFTDAPVLTDDRPYVRRNRDSSSWMWLLLIPLFLLLGLGAYSLWDNSRTNGTGLNIQTPRFISDLFNGNGTNTNGTDNNGLQFGVGGAPATPTPTVVPTSTPSAEQSDQTTTQSSDKQSQQAVQSASDRQLPDKAPATGRGGN